METRSTDTPGVVRDAADFSLMMGGPLYQAWRRTRLSGDALELLHRRTIALATIAWLPLLLLSMFDGRAWGDKADVTFLDDLEMHVRLLVAMPLMLAAEVIVHRWTRAGIGQFLHNRLIPDNQMYRFHEAIASAMRLRNSVSIEVLLLLLVYTIGFGYLGSLHIKPDADTWYGFGTHGDFSLTAAGWWAALVSVPIFQFISVRWFFRIFLWGRLLLHIARIKLKYLPAHPDRCGGIGFLSNIGQGFAPILLAQGALVSGMIADRVFYQGASLPQFAMEICGVVLLMLAAILGPMLFFTPGMVRAKFEGKVQFGALAQRYVLEFNGKWLDGKTQPQESLLGNADIQTLADIGSSYEVVESMRWAPFAWQNVVQLTAIALLPIAPLLLTMFPMEEIVRRVLGVLF